MTVGHTTPPFPGIHIMDYFAQIITYFGAIFAWIMAMGQLALRERRAGNYLISALFFCVGSWLFGAALVYSGAIKSMPHLRFLHIPLMYFVGPLAYLYYKRIIMSGSPMELKMIWHFVPGVVSIAILMIPFYLENPAFKAEYANWAILYRWPLDSGSWYARLVDLVTMAPKLSIIIYLLYLLKNATRMRDSLRSRRGRIFLVTVSIITFNILLVAVSLAGDLVAWWLVKLSTVMVTVLLCVIYLLGQRYPEYLQLLRIEAMKMRYERSRIRGLDVDLILKRLREIMENERAFTRDDLTLSDMARELSITPHQLSEILNELLDRNFYSFVNEYRIREASRLLNEEPERTILSIALASGFNSKSSFNSAFLKYTGLTPSVYRLRERATVTKRN